jgi:hypothetical protein
VDLRITRAIDNVAPSASPSRIIAFWLVEKGDEPGGWSALRHGAILRDVIVGFGTPPT